MATRAIVRDPEIHRGRWHFTDTTIFVDELHRDYQRRGEAIRLPYQQLGLTVAEIDAGLAFEYPEVTEPVIELQFTGVTVHCVCGDVRQSTTAAPAFTLDPCVCGRTWQLPIKHITPVLTDYRPPAELDGPS
jgi:uncharacterized protein (DUF433 family)